MNLTGNILKMKSIYHEDTHKIDYFLPIGSEEIFLNDLLGQKIALKFSGMINCIYTGNKISKTYFDGYSYDSFRSLARCDECILRPELCHYSKGTCREPKWGEENCLQDHYVYLANSSGPKVGITRLKNTPTRWIDQGAIQALPILKVKDRLTSGLLEIELKKYISDKTHWKKMLSSPGEEIDLTFLREELFENVGNLIDDLEAEDLYQDIYYFKFPVLQYPSKIKSVNFDKNPTIEGKLIGIKGQYLLFDEFVLNIRKHQGYLIEFNS